MNKEEAEKRIVELCKEIDEARERNDDVRVQEIKAEILECKKITGPRRITGAGDFGGR